MKQFLYDLFEGLGKLAAIIIFIGLLTLISLTAKGETPEFLIPIEVSPGGDTVLVPSYDPYIINLDNFYERSNETGLNPTYGWNSLGKYYETRVTHGPVERFEPGVTKNVSREIYSSVVPEPSSLFMLATGAWFITRRRRHG